MNNLKNSKRQEFKTWKKLMNCKSKKYWHQKKRYSRKMNSYRSRMKIYRN